MRLMHLNSKVVEEEYKNIVIYLNASAIIVEPDINIHRVWLNINSKSARLCDCESHGVILSPSKWCIIFVVEV